jgi:hypothetical protein
MSAAARAPLPWRLTRALARSLGGFWSQPIRAEPLALFRVLLGLTFLASLLTGIGPDLHRYCGPDGLCPAPAADEWLQSTGRFSLLRGPTSVPLLGDWLPADLARAYPWLNRWLTPEQARAWADWGETLPATYLLFGLFVLALALMTLGLFTRPATVVAWVMACTFHNRLSELMNGGDALLRTGLYFLMFAPAGAAWSLDRWRRARAAAPAGLGPVRIAPWSVRLLQIQFCAMYLFTGLAKARGDWVSGEAMYWVLNDVALCRWPYCLLPVPMPVCRVLSWGTLVFEIGFPLFVLVRPLRRWLILAGLGFHAGILLSLEIGWFSQAAMCWYALFLRGETACRLVRPLGGLLRRPAPAPVA